MPRPRMGIKELLEEIRGLKQSIQLSTEAINELEKKREDINQARKR